MFLGTRDEFPYFECAKCGCLQICSVPENLAAYYPREYYSPLRLSPVRRFKEAVRRPLRARRFESLLLGKTWLASIFPETVIPEHLIATMRRFGINRESSVLDVGCGPGKLLRYLHTVGFRRLTGIDPFLAEDAALFGCVRLLRKTLESVEGEFDLVLSTHSLEHMPDQDGAVAAISRLLSPSGVAVVRIPTVSSHAWETYRSDWVQLDAPRHLCLHSRASFRMLMERHGLLLADLRDDSTEFQFWGSEQYRRGVPLSAPESYLNDRGTSLFAPGDMDAYRERAETLNRERRGDQFSGVLVKGVRGGN
jgi:SAM-dependent methyltransferase